MLSTSSQIMTNVHASEQMITETMDYTFPVTKSYRAARFPQLPYRYVVHMPRFSINI